jgi:hypothetical protein
MITIEELMNYDTLIDNINNNKLSVSEYVKYTERFILVKKCLEKIYNIYTKFHENTNNEDIDNYYSFLVFLERKQDSYICNILINDIKNNLTNSRYYDDTIIYVENENDNNHDMSYGEYEFKRTTCLALSHIFDINKPVLYEMINEKNELS